MKNLNPNFVGTRPKFEPYTKLSPLLDPMNYSGSISVDLIKLLSPYTMPNSKLILEVEAEPGGGHEAFNLFREMIKVGKELREVTMVGLLSACANLGALEQGRWVHEYILRRNRLVLNVYVGTALIDMYVKCWNLEEGFKVFRVMKVKNVCTWNVLILAYSIMDD